MSLDTGKEEIASRFTQSRYSRLLVYSGTIDNILGVLHQKDFYTGSGITSREIGDILSPVMFVSQSIPISAVLRQMQKEKVHIAVVLDKYGGTYGIVTMEDILEELVGEIWDEHDEVTEVFRQTGEHTWQVEGNVDLADFLEFFHISQETEATSLHDWISSQLQRLPKEGDQFPCQTLSIRVSAVNRHRVTAVEVTDKGV